MKIYTIHLSQNVKKIKNIFEIARGAKNTINVPSKLTTGTAIPTSKAVESKDNTDNDVDVYIWKKWWC